MHQAVVYHRLEGYWRFFSLNVERDAGDGTRWLSYPDGVAVVIVSRLCILVLKS